MTDRRTQIERTEIEEHCDGSVSRDGGVSSAPWFSEPGVEGMDAVVERLKAVARQVEDRVEFTTPWVHRLAHDGEGRDETIRVLVNVIIPQEWDGFEFRDRFFDLLTEAIDPADEPRLAVGVRYRNEPETS